MRHHLLFSVGLLSLLAGVQAAYASCPNGSNTSTSATFCSGAITLPDTHSSPSAPVAASPYPAPITVAGMNGPVSTVTVTIDSWAYSGSVPYALELMLASPNGTKGLVFFAFNCGASESQPTITLNLTDGTSTTPPDSSCSNNATYKPYADLNYVGEGCPTFPGATPSSPACADGSTIGFNSTFGGLSSANGTWNVYAQIFDTSESAGSIAGINLSITTTPSESGTSTSVTVNPNDIFNNGSGNSSTFTATVTSNAGTVNEGEVQFYDNGATAGTPVAVSGGQAQLDDIYGPATPEGLHKITAVYTDNASSPLYESSNNDGNPTLLFINNPTTVSNSGYTFCNPGTVTVSNTGSDLTSPYPQHVYVTGLTGSLAGVTLQLNNIHTSYGLTDWYVLLVAPDGKSFVPMAAAGGYAPASGVTLTLSDNASAYLAPGSSDTAPASGSYLPTAYSTTTWPTEGDTLFGPPQSGYSYPYSIGTATFAQTFASENLNGSTMSTQEWSLYVADQAGDSDTMAGYCLTFVTNNAASTTTTVSASPNPDITGTQVTLTAKVTSGGNPVTSGSVKFEQQGNPTPLGTGTLDGTGHASINFTPSTEGQYNITAIYGGVSGTYNTSEGSTTLQVDNQSTTTNNGNNNYSICNPGTITLTAASNTPQQYPSRVLVSNLAGVVVGVTVTLDNLTYSYNSDLEMMLAGPNSTNNIVFWGNVGGDGATNNQNFTIADGNSALPSANTSLTSGTYAPTVYTTPYTIGFTAPAPASPNLAATAGTATFGGQFANTTPNGYWSFYVMEPGGGDHGSIGQHCVNITITPPALAITKSHTGSFTQGDTSDTYTITVTNNGPGSTLGTLTLSDTLPTGMAAVSMSETGNTGGGTGTDWSCTASSASCTRTTAMAQGETDTITLKVSVSYNTPTGTNAVTNSVSVSGGGSSGTQTANDETTINVGPGYVLNLSVNPSGAGTVMANPTNSAGLTANHYVPGATVTLTATPTQTATLGYTFSNWSGSGDLSSDTNNSTTITMNSPTENVTANFQIAYQQVGGITVAQKGGWTNNRITKQSYVYVLVTNTTSQTISGPIQVVASGMPAGVTGANNTGTFNGNPYWTATGGSLAPGASVQIQLFFHNPNLVTIGTLSFTAYSGNL
jgi:hypothetical protein